MADVASAQSGWERTNPHQSPERLSAFGVVILAISLFCCQLHGSTSCCTPFLSSDSSDSIPRSLLLSIDVLLKAMSSGQCLRRAATGSCSLRPASSLYRLSTVATRSPVASRSLSICSPFRSSSLFKTQARYNRAKSTGSAASDPRLRKPPHLLRSSQITLLQTRHYGQTLDEKIFMCCQLTNGQRTRSSKCQKWPSQSQKAP